MTYTVAYTEDCFKWLHQLSVPELDRVLFAFDPARQVVLLIGGDKAGRWEAWYETNIPIADELYDAWLLELNNSQNR
ncbi:hypothetical protein HPO96_30355 [Kribbella sandramycini]|uniref:Uncharacterized protein n=1 Tax=Kribbella sandramycini TaxID=60450 RepID=A0A7Y4L562_9ACTN|nr:type II toxin-antitoxin system RelE/ParE family toxin [Kribbella sandramycini]MBB6566835.1 hypothetical protein [Kribbella sandramycini]NOL44557.1 hypothetical protein [Kribbella sandramycini]